MRNVGTSQGFARKIKRVTHCENIVANPMSDEELVPGIYKEHLHLTEEKTNNPVRRFEETFHLERQTRVPTTRETCPASVVTRGMLIQTAASHRGRCCGPQTRRPRAAEGAGRSGACLPVRTRCWCRRVPVPSSTCHPSGFHRLISPPPPSRIECNLEYRLIPSIAV